MVSRYIVQERVINTLKYIVASLKLEKSAIEIRVLIVVIWPLDREISSENNYLHFFPDFSQLGKIGAIISST